MQPFIRKTITFTTVHAADLEITNGTPEVILLQPETLIGEYNMSRAQKQVRKIHNDTRKVISVEHETKVYEMTVDEFLNSAKEKDNE